MCWDLTWATPPLTGECTCRVRERAHERAEGEQKASRGRAEGERIAAIKVECGGMGGTVQYSTVKGITVRHRAGTHTGHRHTYLQYCKLKV
jgi:hypothetical protein